MLNCKQIVINIKLKFPLNITCTISVHFIEIVGFYRKRTNSHVLCIFFRIYRYKNNIVTCMKNSRRIRSRGEELTLLRSPDRLTLSTTSPRTSSDRSFNSPSARTTHAHSRAMVQEQSQEQKCNAATRMHTILPIVNMYDFRLS